MRCIGAIIVYSTIAFVVLRSLIPFTHDKESP